MKGTAGLTRQQRRSKSKLVTATKLVTAKRKKKKEMEELPSVRKRDSSTATEPRGGLGVAAPSSSTMTVEGYGEDRGTFYQWYMKNWGDLIGSMEHRTAIPGARFTDVYVPPRSPISSPGTMQVFTIRILTGDISCLKLPLQVYGVVAARDVVDYKRNIIFERGRDDCQTITEEAPYLALTGPTRAIVLEDPLYIEADLKVKGTGQSEDQDLIFLTDLFRDPLRLLKCAYKGKISTLELTLGHIDWSVEATISMKVIHGSWPEGFRGSFAAKTASIGGMEFALLQLTGDDKLPVADDGMIKLQRQVVCADTREPEEEHLEVFVEANNGVAGERYDDALLFKPQLR